MRRARSFALGVAIGCALVLLGASAAWGLGHITKWEPDGSEQ